MTETQSLPRTFLIADLFCGAGGSSTGARRAVAELDGRMNLVAVNHWNTAIATHQANHPAARHVIEDVSLVNPEDVVEEGRLDLLMASPECTYHSRARGGKPIHDQGRMHPWAIHNWLTKLDVRCVLIENVPEFVNWGPLDDNQRPIKSRRGEYFQAWFLTFAALGYQAQWRCLNAADYGDATTRTRFFLLARKDGPIRWPEPSHARQDGTLLPGRRPWRGAREIIDWSDSGRSLLDDPRYQRRPLAANTLRRIAKGLQRYSGPLAPLYIRLLSLPHREDCPSSGAPEAPQAFIVNRHGENGSSRIHPTDQPLPVCTTRGAGYLVRPSAERFIGANRSANAPRSIDDPIPPATTAAGGGIFLAEALAKPFLLGQQSQATPRETERPVPTISASGAISLTRPIVILFYGESDAQSLDAPLTSITAKGRKHGLVIPAIVEYYGNSDASNVEAPLPTVTARARHALVNPTLEQVNRSNSSVAESPAAIATKQDPTPAVPVAPQLTEERWQQVIEQAGIDPRRLVLINGEICVLDIRFRMLNNQELARAMGFDDADSYEFVGNVTEVTRQIGNAVPVNLAAALVKSALEAPDPAPETISK